MLRRFHNWPELLDAYLAQHVNTPFAWGRHDCALFAADAVHIMTGTDLAEAFRLQYDSALGAARQMKAFCGGGLEETALRICAAQGMEEIPVELAQRGDWLLLERGERPALGIVEQDGMRGVFAGEHGLAHYPVVFCRRAWRVG